MAGRSLVRSEALVCVVPTDVLDESGIGVASFLAILRTSVTTDPRNAASAVLMQVIGEGESSLGGVGNCFAGYVVRDGGETSLCELESRAELSFRCLLRRAKGDEVEACV